MANGKRVCAALVGVISEIEVWFRVYLQRRGVVTASVMCVCLCVCVRPVGCMSPMSPPVSALFAKWQVVAAALTSTLLARNLH